jgi:hypothetical protein
MSAPASAGRGRSPLVDLDMQPDADIDAHRDHPGRPQLAVEVVALALLQIVIAESRPVHLVRYAHLRVPELLFLGLVLLALRYFLAISTGVTVGE